jgi:hypothetical protein
MPRNVGEHIGGNSTPWKKRNLIDFFYCKDSLTLVGIPVLSEPFTNNNLHCPVVGVAMSTTASHFPVLSFFQTVA